MRLKFLAFLMTVLLWFFAGSARADLRDMTFSSQEQSARILFLFEGQPGAVKVFITEKGLDVDILGVDGRAMQFEPAAALFNQVKLIPAQGGVRLRLVLLDIPVAARAEVFENSILVYATFSHPVEGASDMLAFAQESQSVPAVVPVKAKPTPAIARHQENPVPEHKVLAEPAHPEPVPAHEPKTSVVEEHQPTGHDGEPAPVRVPLPKPAVGQGMIREASLQAAGTLSEEQCQASEKAVSDDPWALENLARFGACLAREGKTKNAREVFERLLTFDPETVAAYVGLGAIAQDAGETEQARQYYEEALSLGGSDIEAARARDMLRSLDHK